MKAQRTIFKYAQILAILLIRWQLWRWRFTSFYCLKVADSWTVCDIESS